ncbi:MAG: serine kinase [Synergistaceae bacterium]|nr:serine kinase [Synergistaceae bacterium]
MKLKEVIEAFESKVICEGDGERSISGVIAGDLLSFIIGEAKEGEIWVTIQIHLNVAAVAVLKELPMVILASGKEPSKELVDKCREENIALIVAEESSYEACAKLHGLFGA